MGGYIRGRGVLGLLGRYVYVAQTVSGAARTSKTTSKMGNGEISHLPKTLNPKSLNLN